MTDLEILRLKNQGYCCSQILVHLFLDLAERENKGLLAFARGLCMGAGSREGTCGILSAGMGILALYAGEDPGRLALMQEGFQDFFTARSPSGTGCGSIAGSHWPQPNPNTCGALFTQAFEGLLAILAENGIDPDEMAHD